MTPLHPQRQRGQSFRGPLPFRSFLICSLASGHGPGILAGIGEWEAGIVLSDTKIRNAKPDTRAYKLPDSGGLHLFVTPKGAKVWRLRFDWKGKEQTLVLGRYPETGLADARSKRDDARKRLAAGQDPREAPPEGPALPTLSEIAIRWHETNTPRWKPHHAADVLAKLKAEILPTLGGKPIAEVTAADLLDVLRGVQKRSVDVAHRLRARMEAIFAFGLAEGVCQTNPAAMITLAMAPMPKIGHRPAVTTLDAARAVLAKAEAMPAFPVTRFALRFLALTAARPGEVGWMAWTEVEADTWRIPADRMKAGREHVIPLARQALEVLEAVRPLSRRTPFVFPSATSSRAGLSDNALSLLLRRAGLQGVQVPHGWRATFSTVMNERHPADRMVIDLMLAHAPAEVKGQVESAYNRAEHMDRRRVLAQEWADLLLTEAPPAAELAGLARRG